MNSEDINTAVNISIIHIHFKALQHNKAVPISHLNSLALYYIDKMPFWMGCNTEGIICLLVSMELQGIMGLRSHSLMLVQGWYLSKVSCRSLRNNGHIVSQTLKYYCNGCNIIGYLLKRCVCLLKHMWSWHNGHSFISQLTRVWLHLKLTTKQLLKCSCASKKPAASYK